MQSEAFDIIEDRLAALELKVFGKYDVEMDNLISNKPIIKTLSEANTVLMSKLSSRNKINELLKKVNMLSKLFDPMFPVMVNENVAKMEVVLQEESNIKNTITYLNNIHKLQYTLDKDLFVHIISLQHKINQYTVELLKNKDLILKQDEKIQSLLKSYNEALLCFSLVFVKLDKFITSQEIKNKTKKIGE